MAALRKLLESRETAGEEGYSSGSSDIDKLMRKVFDRPLQIPTPAAQAPRIQPRRDPETAFDLIDRAAKAFDVLLSRSQQLEAELHAVTEHSKIELATQQKVAEDWKKLASEMKAHAEETERRLEVMKARSDASEARANAAERRAAELSEESRSAFLHAQAAESRSTEFHDKVVATFGAGTRAHAALEVVATTSARAATAVAA